MQSSFNKYAGNIGLTCVPVIVFNSANVFLLPRVDSFGPCYFSGTGMKLAYATVAVWPDK